MESSSKKKLEIFDISTTFNEAYQLGYKIGKRFMSLIQNRVAKDLILQDQLLPYAQTAQSELLIQKLCAANKRKFPRYWDEMIGIADGSEVPTLHIILLNFRKEILPFILKEENMKSRMPEVTADDCSDILVVSNSLAIAAHNEDANVALVGHTYLVRAALQNGPTFTAYAYAGELPSCAFGFNSHGMAFTLNSVPPTQNEIMAGGIGRNFVSRDLLEATDLEDALNRICSSNVSVGHSYNLVGVRQRKILNVETASGYRFSVREVGKVPFFHANMYLHLEVGQAQDENSMSRQNRASQISIDSKAEILQTLGDSADQKYPIYMTGPTLYTLCTAVIDLDEQTMTILEGNPTDGEVICKLPIL